MNAVQCVYFTPGGSPVSAIKPGSVVNVDYTATAAATATAIGASVVSITATTDCWIVIGATPVATAAAGIFIPGKGSRVMFMIDPTHKISAIRATADGTLNIVVAAETA